MTSVTRTVGGSSCLLCRSIIIFNQHHDGVCCYYILRVLHLGYPVAVPAAAFYQSFCNHTEEGPLDQEACVTRRISNRTFREHASLRELAIIELSGSTRHYVN